ncbi:MAG: Ldh family oxidoreductase [Rhizobiaceae bacterium]
MYKVLTIAEIEDVAYSALRRAGAREAAARSVAASVANAEAQGIRSHGLLYIPIYCEHLRCGKVHGEAVPELHELAPALIAVDAKSGFAHPAIDCGLEHLLPLVRQQGIAALAIRNSYNCGVLGFHTERIARAGLIGLGFTHAPASIAPSGGRKAVLGTNPIAIAAADEHGRIVVSVDQSASVVAKSEITKALHEGKKIPLGLAYGPDGQPTTDPETALKGTMAPAGGYKGAGIAILVELLASVASGAVLSLEATPFSGTAGGPPRTGQFFVAINGMSSSGGRFHEQLDRLVTAIVEQEGAHLPGSRRAAAAAQAAKHGVEVSEKLLKEIDRICSFTADPSDLA